MAPLEAAGGYTNIPCCLYGLTGVGGQVPCPTIIQPQPCQWAHAAHTNSHLVPGSSAIFLGPMGLK